MVLKLRQKNSRGEIPYSSIAEIALKRKALRARAITPRKIRRARNGKKEKRKKRKRENRTTQIALKNLTGSTCNLFVPERQSWRAMRQKKKEERYHRLRLHTVALQSCGWTFCGWTFLGWRFRRWPFPDGWGGEILFLKFCSTINVLVQKECERRSLGEH